MPAAQNRLIDALESSREGMVLVGHDGRIVLVNSEFARFFPDMTGTAVATTVLSFKRRKEE